MYPVKRLRDLKELTDTACADFALHDAFRTMTSQTQYTSVSYGQFGQDICALANVLIDKGLTGQAVAVVGENSYPWVLTYLSVVNINATIVPIDKELSPEAMTELAMRAGAMFLFHSDTYTEEAAFIKAHKSGITTVSFKSNGGADIALLDLIAQGRQLVSEGHDRYSNIEIDADRVCAGYCSPPGRRAAARALCLRIAA